MTDPVDPVSDEFVDSEDFEKFKQNNLDYVENVFRNFTDADDDLYPLAIFDCGEGVSLMPLGHFMESNATKNQLSEILGQIAGEMKPTRYAFISSSWGVDWQESDGDVADWYTTHPGSSLKDHPNHYELAFVINADWSGKVSVVSARMERDGENPPTLGEWESINDFNWLDQDPTRKVESRFLDPVMFEITGAKRRMMEEMRHQLPEEKRDAIFEAISEIYPNGELPDPREMSQEEFARVVEIIAEHLGSVDAIRDLAQNVSKKMKEIG